MESIIVHPKNQMELNALKSVLKDMNIKFEKFHTRNAKANPFEKKTAPKSVHKTAIKPKENPDKGQ